ncbi:hypothetical protein D7Y09_15680 [bacterium 1XD42-1]|nr:hypothetical protein D7X25_25425 [bacterium 1XD42-8]RKJ61500.1 hypothetical protein D7Y09_15680 [bacterium 1XD42-1]
MVALFLLLFPVCPCQVMFTDLIKNYVKKRKLQDEKIDLDYIQLKLFLTEEDSSVKDSRIRGTSEKGAKIQPRKTEEIRSKGQSIGNG